MTVTLLLGTAVCVMGCAYNYTVQHKRGEVEKNARAHARTRAHARARTGVHGPAIPLSGVKKLRCRYRCRGSRAGGVPQHTHACFQHILPLPRANLPPCTCPPVGTPPVARAKTTGFGIGVDMNAFRPFLGCAGHCTGYRVHTHGQRRGRLTHAAARRITLWHIARRC
jgi:hypothetical protein